MIVRTFPEEERSLLGACLYCKNACTQVIQHLEEKHFSTPQNIELFTAIKAIYLRGEPVSFHALKVQLEKQNSYDKLRNELATIKASAAVDHIETNIAAIKESYIKLSIADVIKSLDKNLDNLGIEQIAKICHSHLNETREKITWDSASLINDFEDGLTAYQWYQRQQELFLSGKTNLGLSTGFELLDKRLSGLNKGFYIIIAGSPGTGKTTLAMQIMQNVLNNKHRVGFMSLELTRQQVIHKLNSMAANLTHDEVFKGDFRGLQYQQINSNMKMMEQNNNLFVEEIPINNHASLVSRVRYLVEMCKIELLVVDYIGLIKALDIKTGTSHEKVTLISQTIRDLIKEYRIPALVLCQLNRASNYDVPELHNLRDSGSLEADAHQVIILHKTKEENGLEDSRSPVNAYIRKNRFGQTGVVNFHFNGIKFYPMEDYNAQTAKMINQVHNEFEIK